jgi:hypothetical protein
MVRIRVVAAGKTGPIVELLVPILQRDRCPGPSVLLTDDDDPKRSAVQVKVVMMAHVRELALKEALSWPDRSKACRVRGAAEPVRA